MRPTSLTILGAIWGGGIGLVFGPLPAYGIVFGLFEDLISGPSERTWFGIVWGAIFVFLIQLGALCGSLFGRVHRTLLP